MRLGRVVVEPYGTPPLTELEEKVRVAAAQLGADAAIVEYDGTRLTGWTYFGRRPVSTAYANYGRVVVLTAIHFTDG